MSTDLLIFPCDRSGEQDIPVIIELFKKRYDYLKPKMNLVNATTMIDGS